MAHEYFNDFREWFEDEIQTLIEYDNQEAMQVIKGLGTSSFQRALVPPPQLSNQHSLSRQQLNYIQLSVDREIAEEHKISARGHNHSMLSNQTGGAYSQVRGVYGDQPE
jgi:hypothetical protein